MTQLSLHRPFVLATDLDGTFLGGPEAARRRLYDFIRVHRERVRLMFVTGRDLPFITDLVERGEVPKPDTIIGDVGTTVVDGHTLKPHQEVHDWIEERWQSANERIKALLHDEPGLTLQPVSPPRRVSYFFEPNKLRPSTIRKVEDAGYDVLLSAATYFDVMPRGVSKGPTLKRVVKNLGIDADDVVVAGDTLNDLSLFQTRYAGVVVGGAEPALTSHTQHMPHVVHAKHLGAGGITQALCQMGFISESSPGAAPLVC